MKPVTDLEEFGGSNFESVTCFKLPAHCRIYSQPPKAINNRVLLGFP